MHARGAAVAHQLLAERGQQREVVDGADGELVQHRAAILRHERKVRMRRGALDGDAQAARTGALAKASSSSVSAPEKPLEEMGTESKATVDGPTPMAAMRG